MTLNVSFQRIQNASISGETSKPLVSVIMPVYNAEKHLEMALTSILNQTYKNFEFLIFNDGSTDQSDSIIRKHKDGRIKYLSSPKNHGYVHWLNKGIELSEGKYIARMDSDDISLPGRLMQQVIFMEANCKHVICGTFRELIDSKGNIIKDNFLYRTEDYELRIDLINESCFVHSSVMIRTDVLLENNLRYKNIAPCEDYLMWVKLSQLGKLANLSNRLLQYRIHGNQVTENDNCRPEVKFNIRIEALESLTKRTFTDSEKLIWTSLFIVPKHVTLTRIKSAYSLLIEIMESYKNHPLSSRMYLRQILAAKWFYLCTCSTHLGIKLFLLYLKSGIHTKANRHLFSFFLKSLIKLSR